MVIDQGVHVREVFLVNPLRAQRYHVILPLSYVQMEDPVVLCNRHRSQTVRRRRRPYYERAVLFIFEQRLRPLPIHALIELLSRLADEFVR